MTSIIFMGTPTFSAPILRMLVEEGYNVKAVVTQPDRPVGRKSIDRTSCKRRSRSTWFACHSAE